LLVSVVSLWISTEPREAHRLGQEWKLYFVVISQWTYVGQNAAYLEACSAYSPKPFGFKAGSSPSQLVFELVFFFRDRSEWLCPLDVAVIAVFAMLVIVSLRVLCPRGSEGMHHADVRLPEIFSRNIFEYMLVFQGGRKESDEECQC
jgi:hypothetical protein